MKTFKSLLSMLLSISLMLSGIQVSAQEDQSNEDVFAALMETMGSASEAQERDAVADKADKALADAFGGVDEVIEKSSVPLESITPEKVVAAKKEIAKTPISSDIQTEYVSKGAPMSMLIWGDAKTSLQDTLTNLTKRLYSNNDKVNIRFVVNSDPVPWMEGKVADLNSELRIEEQRKFEAEQRQIKQRDEKFPTNIVRPAAPIVPERMGAIIEISAGQFATVKSLDELAARLAYTLAKINPKVYGVAEDVKFTRNEDTISLINQLVEKSDNEDSKKIRKSRDEVIAEFSAMERLAAAGFNPWALYMYEHRVFTWMADVFLKSPNHAIGRRLVGDSKYKLDDWSRPFRLLLQSNYMAHLQNTERGRGMNLNDTPMTKSLKKLRFRMRAYTEPFYMGLPAHVGPVLVGASVGVVHYYFPEVAQWAMSAVHASGNVADTAPAVAQAAQQAVAEVKGPGVAETVGDFVTKAKSYTDSLLENSFLTSSADSKTTAVATKTVMEYFADYRMALAAVGTTVAGIVLAKNSAFLGEIMHSISRSRELQKAERENSRKAQLSVQEEVNKEILESKEINAALEANRQQNSQPVEKKAAVKLESEPNVKREGVYDRGARTAREAGELLRSGVNFIILAPGRISESTKKRYHALAAAGREYTIRRQIEAAKRREQRERDLEVKAKLAEEKAAQDEIDRVAKQERDQAKIIAILNKRIAKREKRAVEKVANAQYRKEQKEKNRLARIENAKKRKEFYNAVGESTVKAWETLDRVIMSVPSRTQNAAVVGLQFGARKASQARKAGSTFIFEYIPDRGRATKASVVKTAEAAAEGLKEMKRSVDAKSLERERQREKLKSAILRRENILFDESITPSQLTEVLKQISDAIASRELSYLYTQWGITEKSFAKKTRADYYFGILNHWMVQANLYGVDDMSITRMIQQFEKSFHSIDQKHLSNEHRAIGVKFLNLVKASPGYEVQRYISAISTRADVSGVYTRNGNAESLYNSIIGETFSQAADARYYSNFLTAMNSHKAIIEKGSHSDGIAVATVEALRSASEQDRHKVKKALYDKNEKEVISWLGQPERTRPEIRKFLLSMADEYNGKWQYPVSHLSLGQALKEIHPLAAIRILEAAKPSGRTDGDHHFNSKFAKFNSNMKNFMDARLDVMLGEWMKNAKSVTELAAMVESDAKKYSVDPQLFSSRFYEVMKTRTDLITSLADYKVLYEKDFFWAPGSGDEEVRPLERPLKALLDAKRKEFSNSPIWMYDPVLSESIQSTTMRRLISLDQYPKSYQEIVNLWRQMTSRGVSTVTDDMLGSLMKNANAKDIAQLETYAVSEGRVFDQVARDEFAIRQIKRLPEYDYLMNNLSAGEDVRRVALENFLLRSQNIMSEMGIRYAEFLEELSVEIGSTFEEAQRLDKAKKSRLIDSAYNAASKEVKDSRVGMFEQILAHVKTWKPKNQFEFLLYLRGNIEATDFIKEQFPRFGPERIRKIYQSLPMETAMGVASLYLQGTLLARKDVNEGYGKKLTEYIVSQGADADTQKYANLLLNGLLTGLDVSKNPPFKLKVVSALVAMKPEQNKGATVQLNGNDSQVSVGETIKVILEKFPGVGPKIGQFLVGTNRLPEDINKVLIGTQDKSLPPTRFEMFTDISEIVGKGQNIGIELGNLLGAGSLKYSALGKFNGRPVALQIFRKDVQNNVDFQIAALHGMIDDLIKKGGTEWAFLRVIVDGAVNAVYREKDFLQEAAKTKIAREQLYTGFNTDEFLITVPKQQQLNKRLLVSDYAKGISFKDETFPEADKLPVAVKLLEMEAKILYGQSSGTITYDTDRHAGNYLIDIQNGNGKKKYVISPIDFGQLTTITVEQRDRVERLFSLSSLIGQFGHNEWLVEKVAQEFGLKGKNLERLSHNLKEFFPLKNAGGSNSDGKEGKAITDYFSMIAAINESFRDHKNGGFHKDIDMASLDPDLRSGKLDFAYTDFVRAIIQLNQYEDVVKVPQHVKTPSKILSERVKDKVAKHLKEMELSRWQRLGLFKMNAENWLKSKVTGEKYEEIQFRLSREQLDKFSVIGGKNVQTTVTAKVSSSALQCRQFYKGGLAR